MLFGAVEFGPRKGRKRKISELERLQIRLDEMAYAREMEKMRIWKNIIRPDENDLNKKRRWEEMDHDILVNIMKRLSWWEWEKVVLKVCKPWLLAALDVFFPFPSNILDLRPHDDAIASKYHCPVVMLYLKLVLDTHTRSSPTTYTQLFFPKARMTSCVHSFIAQRLPSLKQFELSFVAGGFRWDLSNELLANLSNLEEAHVPASSLTKQFTTACKNIRRLHLLGVITDGRATLVAQNFPLLQHLEIPYCVLSCDALSIILDGHKNLVTLNTQHCCCLDQGDLFPVDISYIHAHTDLKSLLRRCSSKDLKAKEWKEEEILPKSALIKRHLQCARKNCSHCSNLY